MIRGATTSFRFKLPRNFEEFESIKITFWQNENDGPSVVRPLPIIKIKDQCMPTNEGNACRVKLSAEETLRFLDERKAFVHFYGFTIDGRYYPSEPHEITVYPNPNNDVLEENIIPSLTLDGLVVFDGEELGDEAIILNGRNIEI